MRAEGRAGLQTDFVLNDQVNDYPIRSVETVASREELDEFVRSGYQVRRRLLNQQTAEVLGAAVLHLAQAEADHPDAECLPGMSSYIRSLLEKDEVFHPLLRLEPVLSIARLLLGPQRWIDLEARLNHAGCEGVAVPWHGHLPVIPDPLPPLFCFPHQIHCLIYLDRITEQEGALCLIPGSHLNAGLRIPLGDQSHQPGQVELFFEPGDAVLIHANLWHRTVPSTPAAGFRRLLLLGYVPSWLRADVGRGVPPDRRLTEKLVCAEGTEGTGDAGDAETRELLGEFRW
ncbi:phytanoyl-CoA dioxygenase family protein [Streptosporangium sp. NPDC002721]|uniref:phytanoyl-CoA dioxygenase family protein n=1 Tax=Streptosporangium sp. NPDC002721 TaxID=3366188 RepID=UPI0036747CB8